MATVVTGVLEHRGLARRAEVFRHCRAAYVVTDAGVALLADR
ncbi:hypothetical protein ACI798_20520 [Geodermatophilus sp. SYSU D01045]